MKKILFLSIMSAFTLNLYSAELDCNIQLNLTEISEARVTTLLDQKKRIDSLEGISAYVTEKANSHFVIEAYLVDYELRIYAEGSLKNSGDRLVASTWGRESIVDIECRLASK